MFGVAYWFGRGPAILALVVSFLAYDYFFVPPLGTVWPFAAGLQGWVTFVAFFLGAGMVALATVGLRRSQRRALNLAADLRESEERLRALGDNLPDSVVYQYMYDYDGTPHFLYISSGTERLNGVKVEEVLRDARVLLDQILPEHYPEFLQAEAASARDMRDFHMDIQMRRADGEVRWMRLRSSGRVVWDGVQTDATEQKQGEDTLPRSSLVFAAVLAITTSLVTVAPALAADNGSADPEESPGAQNVNLEATDPLASLRQLQLRVNWNTSRWRRDTETTDYEFRGIFAYRAWSRPNIIRFILPFTEEPMHQSSLKDVEVANLAIWE